MVVKSQPGFRYVVPHPGVRVVVNAASMPVSPAGRPLRPAESSGQNGAGDVVPGKVTGRGGACIAVYVAVARFTVKSLPGSTTGPPEAKSTVKLVMVIVSAVVMGKLVGNASKPVKLVMSNSSAVEETVS
jgi:hypothetical protein